LDLDDLDDLDDLEDRRGGANPGDAQQLQRGLGENRPDKGLLFSDGSEMDLESLDGLDEGDGMGMMDDTHAAEEVGSTWEDAAQWEAVEKELRELQQDGKPEGEHGLETPLMENGLLDVDGFLDALDEEVRAGSALPQEQVNGKAEDDRAAEAKRQPRPTEPIVVDSDATDEEALLPRTPVTESRKARRQSRRVAESEEEETGGAAAGAGEPTKGIFEIMPGLPLCFFVAPGEKKAQIEKMIVSSLRSV
jgi:hypothetical protein